MANDGPGKHGSTHFEEHIEQEGSASNSNNELPLANRNPQRKATKDKESEPVPHNIDLPEDAYGAAMYAFIYDSRELLSGHDHDAKPIWLNVYRSLYVMAVLVINYVFQFLMLYWIWDYIVLPSVHSVQAAYARYHGEFFTTEGIFDQDAWDAADSEWDLKYKKRVCTMVIAQFPFLCFVLMLWVMIMVIEFRNNLSLLEQILKVPACPRDHPELMIAEPPERTSVSSGDDEEKTLIVKLTPCVRWTIIIIILIPKFIIGISLCMLGLIWLSATVSFSELILNSLALEFVINIDDHLFTALLPEAYREELTNVCICIPMKVLTLDEETQRDWTSWKQSTKFMIGVPVLVVAYVLLGQSLPYIGVLPYFQNDMKLACESFLKDHLARVCHDGLGRECFPYHNPIRFG